jgi:predicted HTH domain antitoxin
MAETATLTIQVPVALLKYELDTKRIEERFNQQVVVDLFADDQITSGEGAAMLDMSRLDFLALLHSCGVPYYDYTREELEREQEVLDEVLAETAA